MSGRLFVFLIIITVILLYSVLGVGGRADDHNREGAREKEPEK